MALEEGHVPLMLEVWPFYCINRSPFLTKVSKIHLINFIKCMCFGNHKKGKSYAPNSEVR